MADAGQERPLLALGPLQAGGHVVERGGDLGDLTVTVDMDPCRQVAFADPPGGGDQPAQRGGEPAGQQPGGQRRHDNGQGGGQQQAPGDDREQAEAAAADLVDQQHSTRGAEDGSLGRDDRPGQPVPGAGDHLPVGQGRGQSDVGDGDGASGPRRLGAWQPGRRRAVPSAPSR